MTDAEEEPVSSQKIPKVLMYIEIGTIIDGEASAFEPADKRRVPMPEGLPRRGRIVDIREILVPWPAADAPTRPVQGQLVVASSIKTAARIAEFVVGVVCEQRQLIKYFSVGHTILDNEQGRSLRMIEFGGITNVLLLERNKPRDIGSRFPIARDRVFVDRPVPVAVRSTQRPGIGDHRFRPRLQHQTLPLPIEP